MASRLWKRKTISRGRPVSVRTLFEFALAIRQRYTEISPGYESNEEFLMTAMRWKSWCWNNVCLNNSISRFVRLVVVLLTLSSFSASFEIADCHGQTPPANQGEGQGQTGEGGVSGGEASAMPGGAVIADFDTLMTLIQQTIDPDSWLQAGGTNTISPYPAGVYVDPKGYLKRLKASGELPVDLRLAVAEPTMHPWRKPSKLRTISLKQLDSSLAATRGTGLQPGIDVLKLAGLSRITYVKVLAGQEDVLIAGPAGENEHGFLLHDLATVAALINSKTAPLGCSIEPNNAGILAAQEMLQERGAVDRLARNPKLLVQQMQGKIGDHSVSVFGLPAQCSTAVALIDADEHMKRVAFGTVRTFPRVKSYFDFLDEQAVVPSQSLVRWWFAFSADPIRANGAKQLFQLPDNCVCVLSEQQWVSQTAVRAPTGERDPSADKFAHEISSKLPELRKTLPSYARLCGVFESSLALQLTLEVNGEENLRGWFPNLWKLGKQISDDQASPAPTSVEGLTTWHRLRSGTTVAVVSGGVKMDPASATTRTHWEEAKSLSTSVVPNQAAAVSTAHAQWWWD